MLTPQEIVAELNKHIIGQEEAKKAVAIAMRNRWRRMQLSPSIRAEITPKNILMIGPTGVGKTEIARRLAKLTDAPFLKVEATKFTEIGYVGKEVDSIIRDLAAVGMKVIKERAISKHNIEATNKAYEQILDVLLETIPLEDREEQRIILENKLKNGELDNDEIEIRLKTENNKSVEILTPPGMEDMASQLEEMLGSMNHARKKLTKTTIKEAIKSITLEEASDMIDMKDLNSEVVEYIENNGIVFIDEIDKICEKKTENQTRVSREGVQRDLLPLIEGCAVKTKYGMIKTDHILFITSGAFQLSKPSDLIPELQGRLPIRVELSPLTANDFERILTEPHVSLTKQCAMMLSTENVTLEFTSDGIKKIAEAAFEVNEHTENIGARRLHTIIEKLTEDISYHASEHIGEKIIIDQEYVSNHLDKLVKDEDLSRYIL